MRVKCSSLLSIVPSTVALAVASCTLLPASRSQPPEFAAPELASVEGPDSFPNWSVHPNEVEEILGDQSDNDMLMAESKGGTTGAMVIEIHNRTRDMTVKVKWKSMIPPRWVDSLPFAPGMLDGVNNSPRKELAAWQIQQLFLDPTDFVVPTSFALCLPISDATKVISNAKPTLAGSECVLGLVSLWLEDVTLPDPLLDDERFRRDPVYAHYLANFNLLTYLIKHHDGRVGNFLVSKDDARRQVFAIDNGVAFGGIWYNWFVSNWSDLRVPALRKESIDRLRKLTEQDLHDALGVVSEGRLNEHGYFVAVEPGPNIDKDRGVRYEDGRLQFGLTEDEIEEVWERIEDLIEDVDEGDIEVF